MSAMDSQTIPASPVGAGRAKEASFYRPELDALRFFAFFAVYLADSLSHEPGDYTRYHLPQLAGDLMAALATSGRFGGQLFFLLSGYLITSLLLRERWVTGHVNLRAFYIRRILRIWPLYLFVLLVAALWPWGGARLPLPYFVAYLLLAGNWMTAFLGPPASWASVLWPLPILQQFYLFWPPVIKFLSRAGSAVCGYWTYCARQHWALLLGGRPFAPYSVFPNTFAELDSIGVGILRAMALKGGVPHFSTGKRLLLAYIGLILLLGCGYFGRVETPTFVIVGYPFAVAGCLALFLLRVGSLYLSAADLPRQDFVRALRLSHAGVTAGGPRIRRQSGNADQGPVVLVWRAVPHDRTCQRFLSLAGIAVLAAKGRVRGGEVPADVVYPRPPRWWRAPPGWSTFRRPCGQSIASGPGPVEPNACSGSAGIPSEFPFTREVGP